MLQTSGPWFKDEFGRVLILRGVNLGGSSKVPCIPPGATYQKEGFFDHRDVSFVGRPFPLDEAHEHFTRLREWGFTFLRFLVTWEAVEHAGPGMYDMQYLDYLYEVVKLAGDYGFSLFIDPHEDVWSRFSGGDGAPGWSLDAVGLDMTHFAETGAAIVHQTHGDPFPRMIWPTNNDKLAAATMWTLFFGGNDFAPATLIDGQPAQEYLQGRYIAAMQQVAKRLKGLPAVTGYDTLNEPDAGYIGCKDLQAPSGSLKLGHVPSVIQSMLLGAGFPQEVEVWKVTYTGFKRVGAERLNCDGVSAWRTGCDCVWKQNGVWDTDSAGRPRLLRPDHFSRFAGREVDFNRDYFKPFANRYAAAIREIDPQAIIFVESQPEHKLPAWGADDAPNIVSVPHWYDGMLLVMKHYTPFLGVDMFTEKILFGPWAVRKSFASQMANLKHAALEMGDVPTLVGEVGIPFDLDNKKAYANGDFSAQRKAMDRTFRAIEGNLLSCTLWNYTSDNSNQRGDLWNDEDFSIFSRDQQTNPSDINSGGRALQAVVRPYASKIAGEPLRMSFDMQKKLFKLIFRHDPQVNAPTEIFVPAVQYPKGCRVEISDGTCEVDAAKHLVIYHYCPDNPTHTVTIRPK